MEIDEALDENDFHCAQSFSISDNESDMEHLRAIEKRISQEQMKLSYSERNLINEEIHGVASHPVEETPGLMNASLDQLEYELQQLVKLNSSLSRGFVSSRACESSSSCHYVNTKDFRLRFLRSENFGAKKAAIRLMKFLNLVVKIFGAYALFRAIKQTDFNRKELKVMQTGWLQALPFRDRAGRRIFLWNGDMGFTHDPLLRVKISIYIYLVGTRDIESQRNGAVSVITPTGSSLFPFSPRNIMEDTKNHLTYMSYCSASMEALPIKIRAVHLCIMNNRQRSLGYFERVIIKYFVDAMVTSYPRFKVHVGEETETRKTLSTYGIPVSLVPFINSSATTTAALKKWLKLQRRKDNLESVEESDCHLIDCPDMNDVVFRPGYTMMVNPGNVMFRSLINSKIQRLNNTPSSMRSEMRNEIVMEIIVEVIYRRKGRFLRWESTSHCWVGFENVSEVMKKIAKILSMR